MNKIAKSLTMMMALAFVGSSVACGGGSSSVDKTKTQLYISNYDGGYGSDWLYDIAKEFESEYAETPFQDGKKGVQIHFDCSKNNTGASALSSMASSRNDVYFTEACYYYDFVSSNKLLDITDVVTGNNLDNKTVEGKLSAEQKEYYKTTDGKYYGLPHYLGYNGIMYDMEDGADLVVIFGGTNDYGHGDAPIGKFVDTDPYTFYGGARTLFEKLLFKFPKARLLVLTPLHRIKELNENAQGDVFYKFIVALRETAELFSIPVLDLYAVSGINPNFGNLKEEYMTDGLHPNDAGHQRVFDLIDAYIKYSL